MKSLLQSHYDVLYGLIVLISFGLDIATHAVLFQVISFAIIFIGFVFVVSNIIRYPKDERINYIALSAGFYSFFLCLLFLSIASFVNRFFHPELPIGEWLRYLLMMIWSLFAFIYSFVRRKI